MKTKSVRIYGILFNIALPFSGNFIFQKRNNIILLTGSIYGLLLSAATRDANILFNTLRINNIEYPLYLFIVFSIIASIYSFITRPIDERTLESNDIFILLISLSIMITIPIASTNRVAVIYSSAFEPILNEDASVVYSSDAPEIGDFAVATDSDGDGHFGLLAAETGDVLQLKNRTLTVCRLSVSRECYVATTMCDVINRKKGTWSEDARRRTTTRIAVPRGPGEA